MTMMPSYKVLLRSLALSLLFLAAISHHALSATKPEIVVAISLDMPPYVMQKATSGLEIDIVRYALRDYTLRFIQLPYKELQTAVPRKRADVSVGIQISDDGAFYSVAFITFANYAISKKADGLKIDSISDLKNHHVLAWQKAYLELGDEFERLFSPQSPQHKNYTEVADQKEQVQMFWQGKSNVIVIDGSIFSHFSKAMGHSMSEVSLHPIFPPVTNFKVSFNDRAVRDLFNQGVIKLCDEGKYAQLLKRYDVKLQHTVCGVL
jgi:polar amino acid transport system substrate-binding protein